MTRTLSRLLSNALVPWPNNCAGHRLQSRILGLPEETYLAMHRRNLCRGTWSIIEARKAAAFLLPPMFTEREEPPWRTIVLLGRKVAQAFTYHYHPPVSSAGEPSLRPFVWVWMRGLRILTLPHPSGRNAASWAGDAIDRARAQLRECEPEVPWGSL